MAFWKRKKDGRVSTPTSIPNQPGSIQTSTQTSFDAKATGQDQSDEALRSFKNVKARRVGLFILADQDERTPGAVDIVALHGLNGDWEATWQAETPAGDQVMWLRDFLPQQIPHARIMSFGYDSMLQFSKSVEKVDTFAEELLEALMSWRRGLAAKRPIIFVCHSLGGIVVKKAIIRAHEKDRYKVLLDSIRGVVFFGTPHGGSSLAKWSTVLSTVLNAATLGTGTNKGLSKTLERESPVLRDISKSFVDRARSLQILSFYETDKMDFLNCRVVEEESAILGLPNEVAIAMKGDHRAMCRFDSIDEQRYRYVWTNIQNMAGNAAKENIFEDSNHDTVHIVNAGANNANETKGEDTKKNNAACYRALRNSNYEAHKLRNPTAVPGTCHWLLDHEVYRIWRQNKASDILWLSADPGCGKSVLTSYLVDNLKRADNSLRVPEIVCFFFFKEDSNEQDNASRAISAILHQLYTAQPWLIDHATDAFISEGPAMLGDFETLWKILIASIKDSRSRDIILVLDGLDECELVTRHQLLQSLVSHYNPVQNDLSQPPFVKTIIASRPDNDIKIAFDMLPTIRLRGEDEPEAISKDIELVIQDHIAKAVRRGLPESILGDLKAGLIKGADRTFLWTTMVIDLLESKRGASKKELLGILHSRDIYRIYHRLLEDSSDQRKARRLLYIVVTAVRPLTLTEMSIAMSVSSTHMSLQDLELDIIHNFEERVKDLCGNFIRIVRSTVYLVHQTAREFLLQETQHQPLTFGKWQHSFVLSEGHSQLLDICLQYLALFNVRSSRPLSLHHDKDISTIQHQFLDYAGRFWTVHYSALAPSLTDSQLSRCAQLCNANSPGFGLWFKNASTHAHNLNHQLREGTMQRDIASLLGLGEVVQLLDQMMKPSDLVYIDDSRAPSDDTDVNDDHGPRSIRISQKLQDQDRSSSHTLSHLVIGESHL